MKKFVFSLKAIATLRELEQMRALNELSLATRQRQAAEDAELQQNAVVNEVHQSTLAERRNGFSGESQSAALEVLRESVEQLRICSGNTVNLRQTEIKRLQLWQQSRLQVNLFERLRTTERRRHWLATLSAEQKEMDDMINQRRKQEPSHESE